MELKKLVRSGTAIQAFCALVLGFGIANAYADGALDEDAQNISTVTGSRTDVYVNSRFIGKLATDRDRANFLLAQGQATGKKIHVIQTPNGIEIELSSIDSSSSLEKKLQSCIVDRDRLQSQNTVVVSTEDLQKMIKHEVDSDLAKHASSGRITAGSPK